MFTSIIINEINLMNYLRSSKYAKIKHYYYFPIMYGFMNVLHRRLYYRILHILLYCGYSSPVVNDIMTKTSNINLQHPHSG